MRDWTGYLGNSNAKTPNFDRLAKLGVSFSHAYAASAPCNPSRTALLSGLRPGSTGVYGNGDDCARRRACGHAHRCRDIFTTAVIAHWASERFFTAEKFAA